MGARTPRNEGVSGVGRPLKIAGAAHWRAAPALDSELRCAQLGEGTSGNQLGLLANKGITVITRRAPFASDLGSCGGGFPMKYNTGAGPRSNTDAACSCTCMLELWTRAGLSDQL